LRHRNLGVGREVDITTGRIYRDTHLESLPGGGKSVYGMVEIARPTRLQVIDTFVHRPTWPALTARSGVFAHLPTRRLPYAEQQGVRLPFTEKVTRMGSGLDGVRFPESPRYPELLRHACQRMGWRMEDFDLYRVRLEYPLMDSNIISRLDPA